MNAPAAGTRFPACVEAGYVTGSVFQMDCFNQHSAEVEKANQTQSSENLMLQNPAEEIKDDQPLSAPRRFGIGFGGSNTS